MKRLMFLERCGCSQRLRQKSFGEDTLRMCSVSRPRSFEQNTPSLNIDPNSAAPESLLEFHLNRQRIAGTIQDCRRKPSLPAWNIGQKRKIDILGYSSIHQRRDPKDLN